MFFSDWSKQKFDHEISWFKSGKLCVDGLKMLEQETTAFCDVQWDQNFLDITDLDVEDARIEENIVSKDEDDIDIEI